ncbi:Molybdopterin biosynthesis protein MoeA [Lunatimonas lonarensis]|uniref:Molybdopterin molybdenumtransferase n=1 Tax=Lunatimonas lonarensis TaxID=1232681 RepID=R7ZVP6_9BACT|nr:molybdopterin molybdotransferase MoeA [Lunatimonas lonarensis]EON78157.1 Molybdopterin biosynthesis protein MoeA [Lunatimonas lonarensis]
MIPVTQAQNLIKSHSFKAGVETVPIAMASGRVLAEDILADRDAPPFDRVTMDGIAIRSSELGPGKSFLVEGIQAAGQPQQTIQDPAHCMEVMTGAVLPAGADCVIPYEQVEIDNGIASPILEEVLPFANVHRQGSDAGRGDTLLPVGTLLHAGHIGLMASVGISKVCVVRLPRVVVCATGDELVPIDSTPQPHQIRNSNSSMLLGALQSLGVSADSVHLPDDRDLLVDSLDQLKDRYEVLLFSGSVSKGRFDYLPEVLQSLGMERKIHGVAQRPGKPFLFGTFQDSVVFGFPGNPASTLVCFHAFFTPWFRANQGIEQSPVEAELNSTITFPKPLTYHLLVNVSKENNRMVATPVQNSGSGDLIHLALADGFISLPPERGRFEKGESFQLTVWRPI